MGAGVTCIDCRRPGHYCCPACKAERRRLAAIHGVQRQQMFTGEFGRDRESRVRRYAERVAAGLPLFS